MKADELLRCSSWWKYRARACTLDLDNSFDRFDLKFKRPSKKEIKTWYTRCSNWDIQKLQAIDEFKWNAKRKGRKWNSKINAVSRHLNSMGTRDFLYLIGEKWKQKILFGHRIIFGYRKWNPRIDAVSRNLNSMGTRDFLYLIGEEWKQKILFGYWTLFANYLCTYENECCARNASKQIEYIY